MKIATRMGIFLLAALMCLTLIACADVDVTGIWEQATYTADTELGEGAKTLTLQVTAEEQTLTFTVHTDKTILGDALQELELIAGEEGAYGLYVKTVNGMTIGDNESAYWALYQNGEYSMTGVDTTAIVEGVTYALVKEGY